MATGERMVAFSESQYGHPDSDDKCLDGDNKTVTIAHVPH